MSFPNKFPGTCAQCGGHVGKKQGLWSRGKVYHKQDQCDENTGPDYSHVVPDQYQQAIIDAIQHGVVGPHLLVDAKAGTGKTTITCMGMTLLHQAHGDLALAGFSFGAEDGKRLRKALPMPVEARTQHSLCMGIVRKVYRAKHRQSKVKTLLDEVVGMEDEDAKMREYVRDLLALVQADAVPVDDKDGIRETLHSPCYDFGIPEEAEEQVIEYTAQMLDMSMDVKTYGFTFDDALYLCATQDLPLPQFDVVLVDEVQDWNNCQLTILGKMIRAGARVIAVGDPNQSLYGFRGAQPDAFDRVRELLTSDSRGVEELPMPVCRRSAQVIVDHAATIVPDIMAMPTAARGELALGVPISSMLEELAPGEDMVLSRTNARLVRLKYICIQLGIPAHMLKGDQEAGILCWMVDMLAEKQGPPTTDIGDVMNRAQQWLEERAERTSAYKMEVHQQRVQVLSIICERVMSVNELKQEIRALFAPPDPGVKTVILATIHKAKGSEAKRVWNISPDLLPHPRAKGEMQEKQEKNAQYVAVTRAMEVYYETTGELTLTATEEPIAA